MSRRALLIPSLAVLVLGAAGAVVVHGRARRDVRFLVTNEVEARIRRCGCQGAAGPTVALSPVRGCCQKLKRGKRNVNLPDLGGLPERSAMIERLRKSEGEPISLDAGDLLFPSLDPLPHERAEWRRRAELIVECYGYLGVRAFVPGENDFALGRAELERILAPARFVTLAANLVDAKTRAPLFRARTKVESRGIVAGIVGLFGPPDDEETRAVLAREGVEATDPAAALRSEVEALRAEGVDLVVVLAHIPEEPLRKVLRAVGGVDLGFCTHPEVPTGARTLVEDGVAVAHTLPGGVAPVNAVVRVVRGARGIADAAALVEARWWLDKLAEQLRGEIAERDRATDAAARASAEQQIEWTRSKIREREAAIPTEPRHEANVGITPLEARDYRADQDKRVLDAIDRFKVEVDALVLDPATIAQLEAPLKAAEGAAPIGFLTANECAVCHKRQTQIWRETPHARAWASLERAQNQKDPECVRCHSIGFREPGGFAEPRRAVREGAGGSLDFKNVQCEACHGPRLGHPAGKAGWRGLPTIDACRRCHDGMHDPAFDSKRFLEAIKTKKVCIRN